MAIPQVVLSPNAVLKMDTIRGFEIDEGVFQGQVTRCGLVLGIQVPRGYIGSPRSVMDALVGLGAPVIGESYPHPDYQDYKCIRRLISAIQTSQAVLQCFYRWNGPLIVRDASTLQSTETQLLADGTPLYVTWENPKDPQAQAIIRIANSQVDWPIRQLTIQRTVDFIASGIVLQNYPAVNDRLWNGLPMGYWRYDIIEGESTDGNITYTYTAGFTSRVNQDWSKVEFLEDDRGIPIYVPPNQVKKLRAKPYAFGADTSVNGLTKVGHYPLRDFQSIFGFGG